jgi:hypothetical protein
MTRLSILRLMEMRKKNRASERRFRVEVETKFRTFRLLAGASGIILRHTIGDETFSARIRRAPGKFVIELCVKTV